MGEDIRKLDYGQHIVSGTPGRVFGTFKVGCYWSSLVPLINKVCSAIASSSNPDMIKRRNLRTRNIKTLVLDEADEMLNKGTNKVVF